MVNLTTDLKRKVELWGKQLAERNGARNQLQRTLAKEQGVVDAFASDQLQHKQAHVFMMSELSERRTEAIEGIENITTSGLRMIYDKSYSLKIDTFDEKRSEEGMATYKMEIRVNSTLDGQEQSFILHGGKGGGLQDSIALVLRDSALSWKRYAGFMMFDEAYKFVSRDNKIENVAALLKQNANITGRQYIFATHMVESFAPVADSIIRFVNHDGIVRSEYVTASEIVELESDMWIDEE